MKHAYVCLFVGFLKSIHAEVQMHAILTPYKHTLSEGKKKALIFHIIMKKNNWGLCNQQLLWREITKLDWSHQDLLQKGKAVIVTINN